MVLKNIRLDRTRKDKNCYYKGEIIGCGVKDISFYTSKETGAVFGWPEIRLGLGTICYRIIYPVIYPIQLVYDFCYHAGEDQHPIIEPPLFE
jgi:hypothetical protein